MDGTYGLLQCDFYSMRQAGIQTEAQRHSKLLGSAATEGNRLACLPRTCSKETKVKVRAEIITPVSPY